MNHTSDHRTTATDLPSADTPWPRTVGRWLVTFLGFPAGGLAADLLVGPVDSLRNALVGGLVTGLVLGAVQSWGLRRTPVPALRWTLATGIGLAAGLAAGAGAVGYDTDPTSLVVQGAACGLAVGAAQALVLAPLAGRSALAWPPVLAALWAMGWAITAGIGVEVDQQFTVFGSSGAIVVTALSAVLPLALGRRPTTTSTALRTSSEGSATGPASSSWTTSTPTV